MGIFNGLTIQDVFLVVIGAAILVVGTTSLRMKLRIKRQGLLTAGTVISSKHVEKRDKEGRLIQNYYELMTEYGESGKRRRKTLKSTDEYLAGEQVRVIQEPGKTDELRIYDDHKIEVFGPAPLILTGLLAAVMPVVRSQYGERYMSLVLALILLVVGGSLTAAYLRDKKRNLVPVEAEIVDILYWKNGDDRKKWSKPSVAYYPILRYTADGVTRTMRSIYNSSTETAFKAGTTKVVYLDSSENRIVERGAKASMLVAGVGILLFAGVGIYSSFMM